MFNHESKSGFGLRVEGRFANETSEDGSQRTNKEKRAGKHAEASVTLGGIRGSSAHESPICHAERTPSFGHESFRRPQAKVERGGSYETALCRG